MDNKLTQDYKDNLYEKVLEKKARRTANRKRLASICVVFFIVACFATYGYTKYEKENYNNYFLTESDNIYIDDEYEYFDDLGIKLEFINTDKDSITIGVNIKYEDIANSFVDFKKMKIIEENNNRTIIEKDSKNNVLKYNSLKINQKCVEKDYVNVFISFDRNLLENDNKLKVELEDVMIENKMDGNTCIKDVCYTKEISIEE